MTEPREDAGTQASAEQDKESEGCCWQFMAADDYRRTLALRAPVGWNGRDDGGRFGDR